MPVEHTFERTLGGHKAPLFPLGQVVITANAQAALNPADVLGCLARHAQGDWGDLDAEDKASNAHALLINERLFSSYQVSLYTKIWIITERDRSYTTVLLPSDY
jgi:hypothetical protein